MISPSTSQKATEPNGPARSKSASSCSSYQFKGILKCLCDTFIVEFQKGHSIRALKLQSYLLTFVVAFPKSINGLKFRNIYHKGLFELLFCNCVDCFKQACTYYLNCILLHCTETFVSLEARDIHSNMLSK